jgi:hypothetical protein
MSFCAAMLPATGKSLMPNDVAENLYSLKHGFRVLSSYRTNAGETLWLITEADRASTTILLPQEY